MKQLRDWQKQAVAKAVEAVDEGKSAVIHAIMGAGKSVAIAELAARSLRHGEHVVITVPTQNLVRQLAETVEWWTGQPVGQWYADHKELWPATVVCQPSIAAYEEAWREKYQTFDGAASWSRPSRLWIADECHKTECATMLEWPAPMWRVGFTATPWRAEHNKTISMFDQVVFEYGADRAFADGHIVKPDLAHPKQGDVDEVCADWISDCQSGGGVVNASSIADAEGFARLLRSRRIDAIAVHSQNENDAPAAREHIRAGGVVVYVDMLAEGFDCPEILWMVLRRPVGSRVRFAQEVGRGLRACPALGKTSCKMLDVWDLWGAHSMNWRAALGEIEPDEAVAALQLDWALDKTGFGGGSTPDERMPPEVLDPLRSWIRAERVRAMFEGRITVKDIGSRHWRSDPCSRKQLSYLDDNMRRVNPATLDAETVRRVRAARAALVDCISRDPSDLAGAFRKGDASDLIDLVRSLA